MPEKLFVGVDIGKDSIVASLCLAAGKQVGKSESFDNSPRGFKKLSLFVEKNRNGYSVHLVTEATGVYGLKMVEYFQTKTDWAVSVLNPSQVKAFVQSQMSRTKTDPTDSYYMAQYGVAFHPATFRPAAPAFRELESIMSAVVACKNRARQVKNRQHHYRLRPHQNEDILRLIERQITQDEKDIEEGLAAAERLALRQPGIRQGIDLLQTIPGVGKYTAFFLLPRLAMLTPLFADCRKFVAYCGMVPEDKQSGTSIHFRPRLSRKGNGWLRSAVYFPALTVARLDPDFRDIYQRGLKRGKRPKQALVLVMAKILKVCWGVYRSGKPFDRNALKKK